MAEKVVSVVLRARTEGFTAGMSKAKKSVDELTKAAAPSKADAFGKLADRAALAGVGVATAVGVAVKRFADFDQAMSAVQANSGATGKTLDSLRDAAVKMGADSQFSATEAAQGINEMAKAGVEAKDILGGGLKGALDLAAAGQISVADAAQTAATAMSQFGLSGDKVPHIADLLANAANKAQGGVGDMSAALNQAGLVANGMGLSIEETTGGLTAFAKAGLLGSDAGTSFKTMLQRLAAPAGEAAALMDKMNISAYDSQGNFVGLANVAGQLTAAFKDKSLAERNAAFSTIFGSDAVRAANVLYNEGADGINKWTAAVSEQGAAAKQAAALTDNLKGDIERLGGALDSVFIQAGSGANGSLRGLTQGLTEVVNVVGKVPGPLLLVGTGLTALALIVPKGTLAWRKYRAEVDAVTISSARSAAAMKALEGAAAVLAVAAIGSELIKLQAASTVATVAVEDLSDSLDGLLSNGALSGGLADLFRDENGVFGDEQFVSATEAIKRFGDSANDALGDSLYSKFVRLQDLGGTTEAFEKQVTQLDGALAAMVESGHADQAKQALDRLTSTLDPQVADAARAKFTEYATALDTVGSAAVGTVAPQAAMQTQMDKINESADDAKKALDDLRSAIEGLGSPLAAQRAAERDYQAAIDASADRLKKRAELEKELADAKKSTGASDTPLDSNADGKVSKAEAQRNSRADSEAAKRKAADIARITAELALYTKGFDVNTEAGRNNQAALDEIRDTTLKNVTATFDSVKATKGVGPATDAATAAMQRGRDAFIKAATDAGMLQGEAEKLADSLGLVPKDVKIQVSQSGASAAEEAIDRAARDRTAIITVKRRIADFKALQADQATSDPVHRADGGRIPGYSPHARADNILVAATAGEFMIRKAAADSLGKATLDYLNRYGRLPERHADGGAVAARLAPIRLAPSLSSTRSSSDGFGRGFLTGSLDLGDGLTGRIQAVAQSDEAARSRRGNRVSL